MQWKNKLYIYKIADNILKRWKWKKKIITKKIKIYFYTIIIKIVGSFARRVLTFYGRQDTTNLRIGIFICVCVCVLLTSFNGFSFDDLATMYFYYFLLPAPPTCSYILWIIPRSCQSQSSFTNSHSCFITYIYTIPSTYNIQYIYFNLCM